MHNIICDFSKFSHKMTTNVHINMKLNPYINILIIFNLHLFVPCSKNYYFHNDIWTQKKKKTIEKRGQTNTHRFSQWYCDLKIMFNIFYGWMKAGSLIRLCGRWCRSYCASRTSKVQLFVFCFWLYLLFCKLLWSGFGELVLVMECDLDYSIENLYG